MLTKNISQNFGNFSKKESAPSIKISNLVPIWKKWYKMFSCKNGLHSNNLNLVRGWNQTLYRILNTKNNLKLNNLNPKQKDNNSQKTFRKIWRKEKTSIEVWVRNHSWKFQPIIRRIWCFHSRLLWKLFQQTRCTCILMFRIDSNFRWQT